VRTLHRRRRTTRGGRTRYPQPPQYSILTIWLMINRLV
jgi:hypothetical protein